MELPTEKPERDAMQARMHKLAGSAGLIGAVALSALAKQVENRLRDGEYHDIPELLGKLRDCYGRLDEGIAPVILQDTQTRSKDEPAVLKSAELYELREALRQKKISAMHIYRKLQPGLRSLLTEDACKGLDESMTKLDFTGAQKWLAGLTVSQAADGSISQDVNA
jgi:HPt (histidine-containing phosphotransfer) domain-containing protein